jgi:hypothetical protein
LHAESSSATIGLVVIALAPANAFDRSLGLLDESKRLRRVAWDVRRSAVWSRAAHERQIHGASDIGQTDLTAVIQAKVAAGLLPRDRPKRVWVGRGSGKSCDGCEQAITRQHREVEFDPDGSATIRLHYDCMQLWDVERRTQTSRPRQPLQGDGSAAS